MFQIPMRQVRLTKGSGTALQEKRWEYETFAVFDEFLDKNHEYIDIGAWVGPTVLYAAQFSKHCYVVEPDAVAFRGLVENVSLNPILKNHISLFNCGIWSYSGKVELGTRSEFGDSMSSIVFGQSKNAQLVDSFTFDDFEQQNKIKDCGFIKMDIEGGEATVLPSIKANLQKNMPTLFLSLHPFLFENREKYAEAILETLRVYPAVYMENGKKTSLGKLRHLLLSTRDADVSVIETKDWSILRRLRLRFSIAIFRIFRELKLHLNYS